MNRIVYNFRGLVKSCVPLIAKMGNVNLLDKEGSIERLESTKLFHDEGSASELPPVKYWGGRAEELEKHYLIERASASVFSCQAESKDITLLNYGGIKLNNEILDLDFGNSRFLNSILYRDNRTVVPVENCICLWSHLWGGYFDFLLFIYAKLIRIRSAIGESEFKKSVIVYPLLGFPFETELFGYLGFSTDQILDARKYNVKAKKYFLGNNDSFYGQNRGDINLMKNTILGLHHQPVKSDKLIYISRAGRRKLVNEQEIINILSGFGFTIIKDEPRTVSEQISIYRSAKIIVGPHGASFTNILWCSAQTVLVELFSGGYYPPYFRYLANVLELDYYSIVENSISKTHHSKVDADIWVDPEILVEAITYLLKKHPVN